MLLLTLGHKDESSILMKQTLPYLPNYAKPVNTMNYVRRQTYYFLII